MKFENMNLEDMNLKDLRKRYTNLNEKFWIKIREKSDIVYYNGFKAFEIQHEYDQNDEENYSIELPDNIYNLNMENIKKEKENIIESIINTRNTMTKYFVKIVKSINIMISYASYDNNKEKISSELGKILTNIQEKIKGKYENYINLDDKKIIEIKNEFANKYNEYKKEEKILQEKYKEHEETLKNEIKKLKRKKISYTIKIKTECYEKKFTKEELEKYIEDTTNIEYIFIRYFIFNENMEYNRLFTKPEIKSKININNKCIIDKFEKDIKNVVEKYEENTGIEVEKKYQHYFMISKLLNKKLKDFENIYRFEEEYYTSEGKNHDDENKGRIDCVFAKIDENAKESYNTEIYLIELKVDENVIDGTNGINKHLLDIGKLNFSKFKENLENRITYRRKQVLGDDATDIKINPNKFHFWTIIAISDKKHAEEVAKTLIKLTNKEEVKNDTYLPKKSLVIDEQIKQAIEEQKKNKIELDVKFFFDKNSTKNPYDLTETSLFEQPVPFKNMTKEKFIKLWKENKII